MDLDIDRLEWIVYKRQDRIRKAVEGTGYLARTVIGVGMFLLDNNGDIDLLTAKQRATFDKFLKPLLESK